MEKTTPKEHCFDQGTTLVAKGRTIWDLFTDEPIPKEHMMDITGGMPMSLAGWEVVAIWRGKKSTLT